MQMLMLKYINGYPNGLVKRKVSRTWWIWLFIDLFIRQQLGRRAKNQSEKKCFFSFPQGLLMLLAIKCQEWSIMDNKQVEVIFQLCGAYEIQ